MFFGIVYDTVTFDTFTSIIYPWSTNQTMLATPSNINGIFAYGVNQTVAVSSTDPGIGLRSVNFYVEPYVRDATDDYYMETSSNSNGESDSEGTNTAAVISVVVVLVFVASLGVACYYYRKRKMATFVLQQTTHTNPIQESNSIQATTIKTQGLA